jgi:dUTP pyrophosphatase
MDNKDIENYINKLKEIEKDLTENEDDTDLSFLSDLNGLLNQLTHETHENVLKAGYNVEVKVKKLSPLAKVPSYSKQGDAGMDLTITEIKSTTEKDITYGFGIALEIPQGFVGLVFPRSSVRNVDLLLTNAVGVIDSGYRGEIQATFKKIDGDLIYNIGERGAQIIILPYPSVKMILSDELSNTERGEGGFGSTGN